MCRNISGFSPGQKIPRLWSHRQISTARNFRNTGVENVEGVSSETDVTADGSSIEQKLVTFRHAMDVSSLTPNEANIVETTILEASRGDFNKIAGAIYFCHILLETMEIGVSALVTASFHYFLWYGYIPSSKDKRPELNLFLAEATSIIEDAAQLKQIEYDYASIDTMNSRNLQMLLLVRTNWNALAIQLSASLYRFCGIIRNCINTTHRTVGATEMRATRQALHIHAPLASQLGMHCLKNEIEGTAFQILYRRQYATSNSRMCKPKKMVPGCRVVTGPQDGELESCTCLKDDINRILENATKELTWLLSEDPSLSKHVNNMTITARVK